MGASIDELWAVMKGEADDKTRVRVVEALEANDPELVRFLDARRDRIIRVLHGLTGGGDEPKKSSKHRPGPLAEKNEADANGER
jgi:hypothetical protein